MNTLEFIRLTCYAVNIIVTFTLCVYFTKEFIAKRLKASLAWGIGFFFLGMLILNLAFQVAVEVTRSQVMIAFLVSAVMSAFLYYGIALLYFDEGSFFREKMTVAFFFAVLIVGLILVSVVPEEELIEKMGPPVAGIYAILYVIIGTIFYRVSRKVSEKDPRRRAITLVSAAWFIIAVWDAYIGFFWLKYPVVEAAVFLLGSFGFLLLLYGMTVGKSTRA